MDWKLSQIFSTLTCNRIAITHVEQKLDAINKLNGCVSSVEKVVNSYNDRLKLLEYKSIDSEAHSRRNNLLFRGFRENRDEDCRKFIIEFLDKTLGVAELPSIERAHRLGRFNRLKGNRPIIVAFSFYKDMEDILSLARSLRGSEISISRDYPSEITSARKLLWPKYKEARSNPMNQVTMAYPAKLIVNGTVTMDMFPDWNAVMKGKQISLVPRSESDQTPRDSHLHMGRPVYAGNFSSYLDTRSQIADGPDNYRLSGPNTMNSGRIESMDTHDSFTSYETQSCEKSVLASVNTQLGHINSGANTNEATGYNAHAQFDDRQRSHDDNSEKDSQCKTASAWSSKDDDDWQVPPVEHSDTDTPNPTQIDNVVHPHGTQKASEKITSE